jgi:hypothetical protein
MQVDYFEEFPTTENLEKARLIESQSLVYIAAHSLAEFNEFSIALNAANHNLKAGYWPVLKQSYWISPFADTRELLELKKELSETKGVDVLLDLELPLLKPSLFFRNLFAFARNKKLIREILFLENTRKLHFSTAEYPFAFGSFRWFFKLLGVSYDERCKHQCIIMFYSSMAKRVLPPLNLDIRPWLRKALVREARRDKSIAFGLGTLAVGVLGNEPTLSPRELESDLAFCAACGISRAIIFRLGGLTQEHAQVVARVTG